jgi:hypothetical protein
MGLFRVDLDASHSVFDVAGADHFETTHVDEEDLELGGHAGEETGVVRERHALDLVLGVVCVAEVFGFFFVGERVLDGVDGDDGGGLELSVVAEGQMGLVWGDCETDEFVGGLGEGDEGGFGRVHGFEGKVLADRVEQPLLFVGERD